MKHFLSNKIFITSAFLLLLGVSVFPAKVARAATTLSADPTTVFAGDRATLTWSSPTATKCLSGSVPFDSSWSNGSQKAVGGPNQQQTGTLVKLGVHTYSLKCNVPGDVETASVDITVKPKPPTLQFYAAPTSVPVGGAATLFWFSTDATSCTAGGDWAGDKSTGGPNSESTGALTMASSTYTYTLACTGPGGDVSGGATVTTNEDTGVPPGGPLPGSGTGSGPGEGVSCDKPDLGRGAVDVAKACLVAAAAGLVANEISTVILAIFDTMKVANEVKSVPVGNILIETSSEQTAIWEKVEKGFEDCLVYGAGQLALNALNQNAICWLKKGFNGNPLYATKLEKLYLDLSGHIAGDLAGQTGKAVVDFVPGYRSGLVNSLQMSTRQDARAKFEAALASPFPPGFSTVAFYKDFNKGGWSAFAESLSPSGNPFGARIIADQELEKRQQEARDLQQQKLAFAAGFSDVIDPKKCSYPPEIKARVESDGKPGSPTPYDPAELAAVQRIYCKTTTPGKVVQEQGTATVNTDIQRYGFIDTLSKLVNTFMVQMAIKAQQGIF